MSLVSIIGPRPNLFDLQGMASTKRLEVRQPILTDADLEKIRSISDVADTHFKSRTLDTTFHAGFGAAGMEQVLDELCARAEGAVREASTSSSCPTAWRARTGFRSLAAGLRRRASSSDPHRFAHLGRHRRRVRRTARSAPFRLSGRLRRRAINPYLAFETIIAMKDRLPGALDDYEIVKRYIKSIGKGLLKVMSKMGISTYQSYCGAQIFDAVGLKADFVAKYFAGTRPHRGRGPCRNRRGNRAPPYGRIRRRAGLQDRARCRRRIRLPHPGEDHAWTAESVSTLQHAVRGNSLERYRAFARDPQRAIERLLTLRGLFRIKTADDEKRKPVKLDQVEPAKEIVKRFATGAMSFGSISREAHTTLAIAMNRIGGKSNTGEGGEDPIASSRCRTAIRCARRSSRSPRAASA